MKNEILRNIYPFYFLDYLKKTDDIIDIMLSYIYPTSLGSFNCGTFSWGCDTAHLKSLELVFKHNVQIDRNYNRYYLNNPMTRVILSNRPASHIIDAINIFIKYGFSFNDYYSNFLISWNPPVFKYIMSVTTKPIDYMHELITGLKQIPDIYLFDDIKNIIDYIVKIVISNNELNSQDNIGYAHLHYICRDYISISTITLYQVPYYEYLIECLLLNGVDISIQDINKLSPVFCEYDDYVNHKYYGVVRNKKLEIKLHRKLESFIKI